MGLHMGQHSVEEAQDEGVVARTFSQYVLLSTNLPKVRLFRLSAARLPILPPTTMR